MLNCIFPIDPPISYHYSGKFKSPNSEWTHMTRRLGDYELFLMTEGTLYIADNENKYTISKDEYLIMSPTEHQYGYESSDCSFLWFHFAPSEITFETQKELILPQQNTVPNMERIIILLNQIQDADRRYHQQYTNDVLATGILLELYNQLQTKQCEQTHTSKALLYQAILDYIAWNRFSRIRVDELSEYFGYHEKYLSSVFKRNAGISLKQYLLQETMEHAKAQLVDTNQSISQIGYSIGYLDSHNFSHAFKNIVGVTPTKYRTNCIKI